MNYLQLKAQDAWMKAEVDKFDYLSDVFVGTSIDDAYQYIRDSRPLYLLRKQIEIYPDESDIATQIAFGKYDIEYSSLQKIEVPLPGFRVMWMIYECDEYGNNAKFLSDLVTPLDA